MTTASLIVTIVWASPSFEDLFGTDTNNIKIIGKILMTKLKLLHDKPLCTTNTYNYVGAAIVSQTLDKD